jgi:hypothetical protein
MLFVFIFIIILFNFIFYFLTIGIPLEIKNTWDPHVQGTRIVQATPNSLNANYKSAVMAVVRRLNVTLLSISTLEMWGASGFLAKAFSHFDALGTLSSLYPSFSLYSIQFLSLSASGFLAIAFSHFDALGALSFSLFLFFSLHHAISFVLSLLSNCGCIWFFC